MIPIEGVHELSIIEIAKQMKPKLVEERSKAANARMFAGLTAMLKEMPTPQETLQNFLKIQAAVAISNFGAQKILKPRYNDLIVKAAYLGNCPRGGIKVDVLNHQGDLFIHSTNRDVSAKIFDGLLPRVEEVLRKELKITSDK